VAPGGAIQDLVMCGCIWTPPDCNKLTWSGATVTIADVYPAF
jgi:hypothetical protein